MVILGEKRRELGKKLVENCKYVAVPFKNTSLFNQVFEENIAINLDRVQLLYESRSKKTETHYKKPFIIQNQSSKLRPGSIQYPPVHMHLFQHSSHSLQDGRSESKPSESEKWETGQGQTKRV